MRQPAPGGFAGAIPRPEQPERPMPPHATPRLPKWPFIVGDAALLGLAWLIVSSSSPPGPAAIVGAVACVAIGSAIAAVPFLVEYARRQEEVLDERQRALEGLSRTVSDSADQISIAANGIQELAGVLQKHLRLTTELTDKLVAAAAVRPKRHAEPTPAPEPSPPAKPEPRAEAPAISVAPPPAAAKATESELPLAPPADETPAKDEPTGPAPEAAPVAAAPVVEEAKAAEEAPAPKKRSPRKSRSAPPVEAPSPEAAAAEPAPVEQPVEAEPPAVQPAEDGATRIIVTAYIGIGNRLFIRGEGGGLSWEKGTPLQFVSIGRWRWETRDATAPVNFKLYKNDELECESPGQLSIAPGEEHQIKASFGSNPPHPV